MTNVSACWVPRLLSVQILKRFLEREGDRFLQRISTCDESWLHFYDLETKAESMVWNIHHHLHLRRLQSSSLLIK